MNPQELAARIAAFRALLETEPAEPLLRFGLGLALLETGEAAAAVVELEETVRLSPDYTAAYRELGRALERAGQRDEAIAVWTRGIAVAEKTGDLQAGREMEVFRNRLGTDR